MDTHPDQLVKHGVIIDMHQSGKFITYISFEIGVCRNTVFKWINRCEETGDLRDLQRNGCPQKTSQEENQAIITKASRNLLTNAVIIKNTLNIDASVYTVRRHFHDGGLHRYTPACKEKLTARHRASKSATY